MDLKAGHGSENSDSRAAEIREQIIRDLRIWVEERDGEEIILGTLDEFRYYPLRKMGGDQYGIDTKPSPTAQAALERMNQSQTYRFTG